VRAEADGRRTESEGEVESDSDPEVEMADPEWLPGGSGAISEMEVGNSPGDGAAVSDV
jgi:hypothetical protein